MHVASKPGRFLIPIRIRVLAVPALPLVAIIRSFVVLFHEHLLLEGITAFRNPSFCQGILELTDCRLFWESELPDFLFATVFVLRLALIWLLLRSADRIKVVDPLVVTSKYSW